MIGTIAQESRNDQVDFIMKKLNSDMGAAKVEQISQNEQIYQH